MHHQFEMSVALSIARFVLYGGSIQPMQKSKVVVVITISTNYTTVWRQ